MASQAEIDLLVDATRTLPDLERNLARVISQAERGADDIDVNAAVNTRTSLAFMQRDLTTLIRRAENGAPDLDLVALLDQQRSLTALSGSLDDVITQAQNGAPDIDLTAVLNQTRSLRRVRRDMNRLLNDVRPPDIDVNARVVVDPDADRNLRRLENSFGDVTRRARETALSFARFGASAIGVGSAVGSLPPLLAATAAAIQSVAPAAAIGTQAMLTMQLVSGTLKLAMVGVEEAITAAFDPDKAEEFEEALKKLAPEARDFVKELRGMRQEFRQIQQRVQNNFFRGFDDALEKLAQATAPAVTRALDASSGSLNRMALGAAAAATEMGRSGVLGQALDSTTASLQNLERLPAQATTGFLQLAAASGPAMERLSRAVAREADAIAERLANAFESGRLEEAINTALDAIAQLGRIGGNIFSGLGNIIGGVTAQGEGLFFILEDLSEAFEKLTASEEFQTILTELVTTAQDLVDNVLPLLREAFVQLAPVIEELGPPVRDFINQVGPELIPVLQALGPVLLDLAVIFREQLPFAIEVVKATLQVLTVTLNAFHRFLEGFIIPIVEAVADVLNSDYVKAIEAASRFTASRTGAMIDSFSGWQNSVSGALRAVASQIGRFTGDLIRFASDVGRNVDAVIRFFGRLPSEIGAALSGLGSTLFSVGQDAVQGLINGLASMLENVRRIASDIADTVAGAVKNLLRIQSPSRVFMDIGQDTVQGFILGIRQAIPDLMSEAVQLGGVVPGVVAPAGVGTLRTTIPSAPRPVVNVFIGNEQLDARQTAVARREINTATRTLAQGVRY